MGKSSLGARGQRLRTFIASCRGASGAFAPHPAQQEELLSTVSAVQLAVLLGEPELLEVSKVAAYVLWTRSWALMRTGRLLYNNFSNF